MNNTLLNDFPTNPITVFVWAFLTRLNTECSLKSIVSKDWSWASRWNWEAFLSLRFSLGRKQFTLKLYQAAYHLIYIWIVVFMQVVYVKECLAPYIVDMLRSATMVSSNSMWELTKFVLLKDLVNDDTIPKLPLVDTLASKNTLPFQKRLLWNFFISFFLENCRE